MSAQTTNGAADRDTVPCPPGSLPLAGHIRQWRRDPVKLITEAARLGDVVRLNLPGRTYLVTHPAGVKHVLQDNHQNYCKGWVFDRIKPYWGESLLTADGDTWRRQRHRVQPSFKRDRTAGFAPIITRRTIEMLDRWEASSARGELALYDEMTQLALVIIGDVLFDIDLRRDVPEMAGAAQTALAVLKRRVAALAPLPLWIPTPDNQRFNRSMSVLHGHIDAILRRTRDAGDDAPGFVRMLMEARDTDTGSRMTDAQLHEEILGMLQQGHDTVGETLAWVWYLLAQHPEVERRLYREITDAIGDRPPVVADIPRLQYAGMVVQEALRLYPPVWVIPRDAIKDDRIDGHHIPAGSTILLSPYVTHRYPEFWDNPEAFDPDRFLPERVKERPRHAYFPFGGGPRLCMGADMALMEVLLIVVTVVQRFRLPLVSGHREEAECILDMIPRNGVRVTPRRRQPLAAAHRADTATPAVAPAVRSCPWAAMHGAA